MPEGEAEDRSDSTETVELVALSAGSVFADRYQILGEIGRGGFGVVYRAFDRGPLQREVALKLINFETTADPQYSALARKRFMKEARTAGGLSHNNIATVFDVGEWTGLVYMTQELAPGRDLRRVLSESRDLPLRRVIAIIRQLCQGLAYAHAKSVIHRDIKPANIVLDGADRVKITDFGLAKPPDGEDPTLQNRVAGTPGYMAPEQLRREPTDSRVDIFAVGCVLYQMLTGRPPFEGDSVASIIEKTLRSVPMNPSQVREDLPRALDRIVGRALRKDPDERYGSVIPLEQDLLNYEQFDYLLDAKQGAGEIAAGLESRQCVVFLGLRLPAGADAHRARTADDIIAEYLAEHLGAAPGKPSLPQVAQHLELERGRSEMIRYLAAISRQPRVSSREVIRRLARLPFPMIVTTRYDNFLEEELAKTGRKIHRVLDSHNIPEGLGEGDVLVYLFGSLENEASIIVTEDDLWNFFGTFGSIADALKSVFVRHSLLFLGYDPDDEGFRHIFSEIARFRAGTPEGCYLPVVDTALSAVRWAQRKGLRLVECEAGPFLSLLEETLVERRRQKAIHAEAPPERPLPSRPYKFLNYYDAEDERIFFGRRSETHKLLTKIHAYSLNLLYAPSGSGKTSLICAGAMPELRREGYCPVYARVYDNPEAEILHAALEATQAEGSAIPNSTPLEIALPQLVRSGQRLVIFLDQFEEIFIRYDRDARDRFAAKLQAIVTEAKGQVRFILSLREDYLARLSEFRDRIPNIFHNEFRLGPLTDDECRLAIVEPAKLLGLDVEPELVDRLVADLSREGIEPPQLQIVCDTLFDNLKAGEKRLELKSYLALGETRKILTKYLERALNELPPTERETAREVLKNLVTSEQTKTVLRISDLVRTAGKPEDEVTRVLSELLDRRLIRRVQHEDGFWYELTHEYLVEEINKWLSEREKQLKKIRELLEQAVRNHRNLGMLMPAAQLRLVTAHEDDLHLSKEERQVLRASAAALSTRRRRLALGAAIAAVFILCCGVTWRYFYLNTHLFVKAQDKEYIELSSEDYLNGWAFKKPYRLENVRIYSGSPERWWLDTRLGFPKPIYQTDFELDELDPTRRDLVKGGLMFSRNESPQDVIVNMLQPDAKVRFLLTTGKTADAVKVLRILYNDSSVDHERLDSMLPMLPYAEIHDEDFITQALKHTFRAPSQAFTIPPSASLALLFQDLPPERWHAILRPFFDVHSTRANALDVLGLLGNKDDAAIPKSYLDNSFAEETFVTLIRSALNALVNLGDCSALASVRRLVLDHRSDPSTIRSGVDYIQRCGSSQDLALLQELARRDITAGRKSLSSVDQAVNCMYRLAGSSAVPAIRTILQALPMDRRWNVMHSILDERLVTDVALALNVNQPRARALAAQLLAEWGRPDGLAIAARVTLDRSLNDQTRADGLRAFEWFQGPKIRTFALKIVGTTSPQQEMRVRAAALNALRWYDDDEVLDVLAKALADKDSTVRANAIKSFMFHRSTRARSYLHHLLNSSDPVIRIYTARVLQMIEGGTYTDTFRNYLRKSADLHDDYALLEQAITGLRDAYTKEPAPIVVEALRDPRRDIRLAATLAIADHPDSTGIRGLLVRAANDNDLWFRNACRRAQWALGVARKQASISDAARSAFLQNDTAGAYQLLFRIDPETLKVGLSFIKSRSATAGFVIPSYVFENAFSRRSENVDSFLNALDLGERSYGLFMLRLQEVITNDPAAWARVREDPRTRPLRQYYAFRVLTGLQAPMVVDNIELPAIPGGKK
jgi:hypothetical protein